MQFRTTLWAVLLTGMALLAGCRLVPAPAKGYGTLRITIAPQFAGQPLVLADRLYGTPAGDSLYVDLLRFYLTALQLEGEGSDYREQDSYHLVDAEDSSSQTIVLQHVPAGRYATLRFTVGTDSLTNVSGAMGGDLDPTRGMYWAWNTGYINVKLEGRSNACPTLHHAFEFHIGGYMPPNQTARRLVLPLNKLAIRENKTTSIRVIADLAQFFGPVQLATTNQVMIPSRIAAQLADYFQRVFTVE